MNSLRATAAPLLDSDVGGTALRASFRHDFASSGHVFAGFSCQTGPQAGESHANMTPTSEVSRFGGKKRRQERAQAAKERPRGRQRVPKRAKLTAKRVPAEPQGRSQGTPEGPSGQFLRSEPQEKRSSRALCGVTRSRSAFEAIFR